MNKRPLSGLSNLNDEVQQRLIQVNLKSQQEAQDKVWKQDCRKTSLQLAERFSKGADMQHESDPIRITGNAEILYRWLIADDELQKGWVEIFMKTGVLHYKKEV